MFRKDVLVIFFAAVVLFTVGMPTEFVGFQTRFALFAREMLDNGPTLFPTTYNQPYPDYPSTSTLLIWLPARLIGEVTPLIAVLPTALASAGILALIYLIGATCSRRWGLLAVLFAVLTITFFEESRTISLDQFVSLATLICFYIVHSATLTGDKWKLAVIPFVLVAGFAIRGPLGFVIPAAVAGGYFLWERAYVRFFLTAAVSGVLLAVCMVALLAAAKADGGEGFAADVMRMQLSGRVASEDNPLLYYWLRGPGEYAISFPIAFFVAAAMFGRLLKPTRPQDRLLAHLVVWTLIVLVGMSIPGTKNGRYILPIAAPISLIASYLLVEKPKSALLAGIRFHLVRFFAMSPLFAAAGAIAAVVYITKTDLQPQWQPAHVLLTLGGIACLAAVLKLRYETSQTQETLLVAAAATAFAVMYIGIIGPIYHSREHTTSFVSEIEAFRQTRPGRLVFYRIGPDAEDIKYAVNSERLIAPEFAHEPEDMLEYAEDAYFVTRKRDLGGLQKALGDQVQILARGNLGHRECVAFKLNETKQSIVGR